MLTRLTLSEMVEGLRVGKFSSEELRGAHLEQIKKENPRVNCIVRVLEERQTGNGPLYGAPVTIKDNFDIAGAPTLCGSGLRAGHVAQADATAVAQLRNAGGVLLAKTNVPELVSSYETDNDVTGRTNNPANVEYTCGGSSGGEAAAIASFCSPGGLGGDAGGSIRIPAHFCGVAGFKPTHRRISGAGQFPASILPSGLMGAPGPMARTVSDVSLLFHIMQGADPLDALSVGKPEAQLIPRYMRIGVWRQFYDVPVHEDVSMAVEKAGETLASLGHDVLEFRPKGFERAPNVWAFFFGELGSYVTKEFLAGREAHWTATENLRETAPVDVQKVIAQFGERERLRGLMLEAMSEYDLLLTPPCAIPAFRHRERRWTIGGNAVGLFAAMMQSTVWNLFGFPALVLPFGRTGEGLPVGVQLVGQPFSDERVLAAGEQLEHERGPYELD